MKNATYLLENFDSNELSVLHKLLKTKDNDIQQIEYQLGEILLPMGGYFQQSLGYTKFLHKIAKHNNISLNFDNGNIEAEQNLFTALFKKEYDRMSVSEKDEYLKKMEANGLDKNQIASLTSIATLGVAQASGFGIYLLASSTIGAISSTLGIALPFALYTTMSSVISFVIGPVGFLIAGIALFNSFGRGDYKTATICFNYIAAMRTIIPEKYKTEINQEKNKLSEYETQKEKLTSELNKNNQQIYTSKEEINTHNNQIQEFQYQIDTLKNTIQNKRHQISNINLDIEKIQKDNIDLRNNIDFNENASNETNTSLTKIEEKLEVFLTKTKNQEQ